MLFFNQELTMQNIVTIYRFNTPFLDIYKEKDLLIWVKNKIKIFLENQGFSIKTSTNTTWNYNDIFFESEKILKIQFKYIKEFRWDYHKPIFRMDVFIDLIFLSWEEKLKKTTLFLTSLFESFDGLNEKEYMIEVNKNIYYTKNIFKTKIYPSHDFQDISDIQKEFEISWEKLLNTFLEKYKNSHFILNEVTADEYHKIHRVCLYYIYLVYIMYKTIIESQKLYVELEKNDDNSYIEFSKQRLDFIKNLNISTFKQYYEKLEIFFTLFK